MELHWLSCFRDVFVWPHCECFSKRTPQLVRMGPPESQEPCRLQVAYKAASGEEIESHKELGELSNKDLSARTSQSMQNCLQNASWSALSIEFGQQNVSKLCLSYNRSSDDSILYFILENNPCGHPGCVSQNMGIYIHIWYIGIQGTRPTWIRWHPENVLEKENMCSQAWGAISINASKTAIQNDEGHMCCPYAFPLGLHTQKKICRLILKLGIYRKKINNLQIIYTI